MKKFLLTGLAGLLTTGMAVAAEPIVLHEFYTNAISPDGNWIVNDVSAGQMTIYNLAEKSSKDYADFMQGNGNKINNAGTLVGSMNDCGALIFKGEIKIPTEFTAVYPYSSLHGISADGSRACGLVSNIDNTQGYEGCMYIPVYVEIDADGNILKINELPTPEKDLFGMTPQYHSAVWISDDGKRILGQQIDNSGMFISPIVYTEDADGKWSYSLPTEPMFNPDHIEIPEYPGDFTLPYPEAQDYMSVEEKEAYDVAYEDWIASQYQDPYPEPIDFMSEENAARYQKDLDDYNTAANEYNMKFNDYTNAINAIAESSLPGTQNSLTLSADGKKCVIPCYKLVDKGGFFPEEVYLNYVFNLENGGYEVIPNTINDQILAGQILENGAIIGSTPASLFGGLPPRTYIYLPGADDFVSLEDFLQKENPEYSSWMVENLSKDIEVDFDPETYDPIYEKIILSGHAVASNDMKTISGGIMAYYFETGPFSDDTYASYIFTDVNVSSLKSVENNALNIKALKGGVIIIDGEQVDLKVFDIAGRKVFSADKVNGSISTGLNNGIYIVKAGEKSLKVRF